MKRIINLLGLIPALMLPLAAIAQINPEDLLPVDEAFAMSTEVAGDGRHVRIEWKIAEGYYLYRHAFKFDATGPDAALGEPDIPPGKAYSDEFFGDVEIYRDRISAMIPVEQQPAAGPLALRVAYQGCADLGVCYPPQRVQLEIALPEAPSASNAPPLAEPATGAGLLDQLDGFGRSHELTGRSEPLPPKQAFRVETIALGPGELLARFTVHPDYYLYRDSIEFEAGAAGVDIAGMTLPEAVAVSDEYFGDTFAYFGEVEIPLALARPAGPASDLALAVRFQGCQTDGICYPPMARTISVDLPAAGTAIAAPADPADPAGNATGASPAAAPGANAAPATDAEPVPESEQDRLARLIT